MTDLEQGFVKGFEEARRRVAEAISLVKTETFPPREPFSYESPVPSPRRPGDVLEDCLRLVREMKVPKVREVG